MTGPHRDAEHEVPPWNDDDYLSLCCCSVLFCSVLSILSLYRIQGRNVLFLAEYKSVHRTLITCPATESQLTVTVLVLGGRGRMVREIEEEEEENRRVPGPVRTESKPYLPTYLTLPYLVLASMSARLPGR